MITDNQSCKQQYEKDICTAVMTDYDSCTDNGGTQKICGVRAEMSASAIKNLKPVFDQNMKNIKSGNGAQITRVSDSTNCALRYAGFDMTDSQLNTYCTEKSNVIGKCENTLGSSYNTWCAMTGTVIYDNLLSTYNGIKVSVPEWQSNSTELNAVQSSAGTGKSEKLIIAGGASVIGAAGLGYAAYLGMKYLYNGAKSLKDRFCGSKNKAVDREALSLEGIIAEQKGSTYNRNAHKENKTAGIQKKTKLTDVMSVENKMQAVL